MIVEDPEALGRSTHLQAVQPAFVGRCEIAGDFPLSINLDAQGTIGLLPARREEVSGLGAVLAELERAATRGRLDRLKMCASAECLWIFYDHSKPGSRRWCVSSLCGNREKTRAYRRRHQDTP